HHAERPEPRERERVEHQAAAQLTMVADGGRTQHGTGRTPAATRLVETNLTDVDVRPVQSGVSIEPLVFELGAPVVEGFSEEREVLPPDCGADIEVAAATSVLRSAEREVDARVRIERPIDFEKARVVLEMEQREEISDREGARRHHSIHRHAAAT